MKFKDSPKVHLCSDNSNFHLFEKSIVRFTSGMSPTDIPSHKSVVNTVNYMLFRLRVGTHDGLYGLDVVVLMKSDPVHRIELTDDQKKIRKTWTSLDWNTYWKQLKQLEDGPRFLRSEIINGNWNRNREVDFSRYEPPINELTIRCQLPKSATTTCLRFGFPELNGNRKHDW